MLASVESMSMIQLTTSSSTGPAHKVVIKYDVIIRKLVWCNASFAINNDVLTAITNHSHWRRILFSFNILYIT